MVCPQKILVLRFSALGDVAMVIPVLWALKQKYPGTEILFVSQPFARDLIHPIGNIEFFGADFKSDFKGIQGIFNLFRKLRKIGRFDRVIDLHGVLRSRLLTFLFRLVCVKTVTIRKGRREKKALTRRTNKVFTPLETTFERYRKTFEVGGYTFEFQNFPGKAIYTNGKKPLDAISTDQVRKIGIAPFAKHKWKVWPIRRMRALVDNLAKKGFQIFLFGSRGNEQKILDGWSLKANNVHNLAGSFSIGEELNIIAQLDLMITMDSANLHFAGLVGTKVISIWGATHPYAGFYGWGQPPKNALQVNLACRPCSVYGNKPCYRRDFACMELISENMVLKAIEKALNK